MSGSKDDELYIRFLQFGVFSPINRLHSSCCETFSKEPGYFRNGVGLIAEEYLRFRHRLIPFLYTAAYENKEKGCTLIEPMYYEYPEKEEAYQFQGQYLFGKQLLVAPIVSKSVAYGIAAQNVWLPEGKWTDIFTGFIYTGGKIVEMHRYLEEIPVLASEGTILVLDSEKNTNGIENPEMLEVWLFNGNGSYTLYEEYEDEYEIVVLRNDESDEAFNHIFAREIACMQWLNEEKEKLYNNIVKNPGLEDDYIENSSLPQIYKKRLSEIERNIKR